MEQPTRRARREFSAEFKARTVELILSSGKSVNEVCRELDLTETAVRRWLKRRGSTRARRRASPATSAPS